MTMKLGMPTKRAMTMAGELDLLLARFAEHRGLARPRADAGGRYYMLLDGDLEVAVLQGGDRIYLEGRLEPVPADRRKAEELLGHHLRLHLARLREKHEVLSLEPEGDDLVLFRQLPAHALTLREFERALEDFANGLEFWSDRALGPQRTLVPPPEMQMLFP